MAQPQRRDLPQGAHGASNGPSLALLHGGMLLSGFGTVFPGAGAARTCVECPFHGQWQRTVFYGAVPRRISRRRHHVTAPLAIADPGVFGGDAWLLSSGPVRAEAGACAVGCGGAAAAWLRRRTDAYLAESAGVAPFCRASWSSACAGQLQLEPGRGACAIYPWHAAVAGVPGQATFECCAAVCRGVGRGALEWPGQRRRGRGTRGCCSGRGFAVAVLCLLCFAACALWRRGNLPEWLDHDLRHALRHAQRKRAGCDRALDRHYRRAVRCSSLVLRVVQERTLLTVALVCAAALTAGLSGAHGSAAHPRALGAAWVVACALVSAGVVGHAGRGSGCGAGGFDHCCFRPWSRRSAAAGVVRSRACPDRCGSRCLCPCAAWWPCFSSVCEGPNSPPERLSQAYKRRMSVAAAIHPGEAAELPFQNIQAALQRGATVLTPNQRTARQLLLRYDRARQAAGAKTWEAPNVLSWGAWTGSLWRTAVVSGVEHRVLLNTLQERELWRRVIDSGRTETLRPAASQAKLCQSTANLLGAYDVIGRYARGGYPLHAPYRRCRPLCRVVCADGRAMPCRGIAASVASRDRACGPSAGRPHRPPKRIPAVRVWRFDAGAVAADRCVGTSGRCHGTNRCLHAAGVVTGAAALRQPVCGNAAMRSLGAPASSSARRMFRWPSIVPDLQTVRGELERELRRAVAPQISDVTAGEQTPVYEFSSGRPLDSLAMVQDALGVLRWCAGPVSLEDAGAMLRSPHLRLAASRVARRGARHAHRARHDGAAR